MGRNICLILAAIVFMALSLGCSLEQGGPAPAAGEALPEPLFAPGEVKVSGGCLLLGPINLPKFCPGRIGKGDKDFNGNGPAVKVDVRLYLDGSYCLYVETAFTASETKSDWTKVAGKATRLLLISQEPIWYIATPTAFSFTYTDRDHSDDVFNFSGDMNTSLVQTITVTGDTAGDDVGETGVIVKTNSIALAYR